ncbi:hypothetical protein ACTXT7_006706 [Hymenolepis weldensis]
MSVKLKKTQRKRTEKCEDFSGARIVDVLPFTGSLLKGNEGFGTASSHLPVTKPEADVVRIDPTARKSYNICNGPFELRGEACNQMNKSKFIN